MNEHIALTHLQRLEAESIHILREAVAEAQRPVMLYSIGKDSATMLHLAKKAFHPAPPPFPLLHIDTMWKFRAMYELRERMARELGMGNVDLGLLWQLLVVSIPGVLIGSLLSHKAPDVLLGPAIAVVLALVGVKHVVS
jgi:3'-phosphoadenosine 5'-phosphosulfate sulfotransferase (PAPS reductase)/FAD synthetase